MSRNSFFQDYLQAYAFWLMDVAPIDAIGLPLFTPIFGFTRITAPEVSYGIRKIKEGNWFYPRRVMDGSAEVSPIVMERGVYFADSDFYRWTQAGIYGQTGRTAGAFTSGIPGPTPRRTFLLVQFFPRSPFRNTTANEAVAAAGLVALAGTTGGFGETGTALGGISAGVTAGLFAGFGALSPQDLAVRIPAKAWLLKGCIPMRYKAASDFDATSSQISMQELEIDYEEFEEVALAA